MSGAEIASEEEVLLTGTIAARILNCEANTLNSYSFRLRRAKRVISRKPPRAKSLWRADVIALAGRGREAHGMSVLKAVEWALYQMGEQGPYGVRSEV